MNAFRERLQSSNQRPLLLDGATGTELNRRGVATTLPLWSTIALLEAPDVLRQVHADYVSAGAEVITANTFRVHARNLASAGLADRAGALARQAVEIAREAANGKAFVAGSQPPLEDCYEPELVPDDEALAREHGQSAEHLAAAGVDVILVETHNTIREAVAAARAAIATELPAMVSFICGSDGRLLSGEAVAEAASAVLPLSPDALLINCTPTPTLLRPLEPLVHAVREAGVAVPVGAFGNIGYTDPVHGWINTDAQDAERYAEYAREWLAAGARILGGCCGTTPAHIARLRELLDVQYGQR